MGSPKIPPVVRATDLEKKTEETSVFFSKNRKSYKVGKDSVRDSYILFTSTPTFSLQAAPTGKAKSLRLMKEGPFKQGWNAIGKFHAAKRPRVSEREILFKLFMWSSWWNINFQQRLLACRQLSVKQQISIKK
jgi:hypothetical protein